MNEPMVETAPRPTKQKIGTPDKVIGSTEEEIRKAQEDARKGGSAETKISKKLGKSNLGRSVLIGAGAVGFGAYEAINNFPDIPALHRSVETNIPSTFDNNADSGVIGENNIAIISREKIKDLPSFNEKEQPVFLFPISDLKLGETIKYEKFGPFANMFSSISKDTINRITAEGVRDRMEFPSGSIPAGTEFLAPISGRVFIMELIRNEEKIIDGIKIEFMSPDNILYFLNIHTGLPQGIDLLTEAPPISPTKGLSINNYSKS